MRALLIVFLLLTIQTHAQKFDYNWLMGYNSAGGSDSSDGHWLATTRLNFDSMPRQVIMEHLGMNFAESNIAISDSVANLLFYCNGVTIRNYLDQVVENGDSLRWGYLLYYLYPDVYIHGEVYNQFLTVLSNPLRKGIYDLFYIFVDSVSAGSGDVVFSKLLRATLDMNANNGRGLVTAKDLPVFKHEINGPAVTAVKHANGRDWWIVTARTGTNSLDILFYNGSNTLISTVQSAGGSIYHDEITSFRFSPDGSKFFLASSSGVINIFDFDRCAGIMTLRESFVDTQIRDSSYWAPYQVEYSPNSRFAYVVCHARVFQFDMEANTIQNSKTVIASYAGFQGPFTQSYDNAQLGPDGKIYVGTDNSNWYYGVIDNPDGQGASCNFLDHNLAVPTFVVGLPTYCNFRLGPLYGSGCDTLTGVNTLSNQEQILKVFPNPANDMATIDYGFTDWSKGEVSLDISNELGQIVYAQTLPRYSGYQKIDISKFAGGFYNVAIVRSGAVVGVAKLIRSGD